MNTRSSTPSTSTPSVSAAQTGLLQRKCAQCENKDKLLQRRATSQAETSGVPPIVHEVLNSPGQPLDSATRSFMEPRFGHDFSRVRIHTDTKAAESAQSVNALAYTVGQNVAFARGLYQPTTMSGRQLLAHELTHVVQQNQIALAPAQELRIAPSSDRLEQEADLTSQQILAGGSTPIAASSAPLQMQRQTAGAPGRSQYEEHVSTTTTSSAEPGVWQGEVRREEYDTSRNLIGLGHAPVRYDETSCRVTVPMSVTFRQPTLTDINGCRQSVGEPALTTLPSPLASSEFSRISQRYIQVLNERLNRWYSVQFDGCASNRCHGQAMPIQVQVTEATGGAAANYQVAIANLAGRSCVSPNASGVGGTVVLFAPSLSEGTLAHEGVHMVLGHGDEYAEPAPGVTRSMERVRDRDWSLAGDHHNFGRFALLHARHFAFVPAFLNHVRPGCRARLVEQSRPPQLDVNLGISGGYLGFTRPGESRSAGLYFDLGASAGIPLSRQRDLELIVGAHGRWLAELNAPYRQAFLLGARLGLEGTVTPSRGGFTFGGFGELGGGYILDSSSSRGSAYVEGGASAGYSFAPSGGGRTLLQLEGAAGVELGAPTNAETLRWFRLGISVGRRF